MRAYAALVFFISIILGSLLPFVSNLGYKEFLFFLCLAIVFFSLLFFSEKEKKGAFLFSFCLFLGLAVGTLRGAEVENRNKSLIENFYNKTITFRGSVAEYPDVRETHTNLIVNKITIDNSNQKISESILLQAPANSAYVYGDIIEVTGKIIEPQSSIENEDQSRSRFSYKNFLYKDNIYSIVYRPQIKLIQKSENSFVGKLYFFKNKCIEITKVYIAEPASGLLSGILFGTKKALGSEALEIFTKAGLVHIVVLSGYNVALVVNAVLKSTKRMPKKVRTIILFSVLILFVLFVGASSTVLRAVIMAGIALFAREYSKKGYPITILMFAAALLSLYDPRSTLYDPGFALSFLATLGLIVWTSIIYKRISFITDKFLLREITATSVSAWLATMPFIMWYIGKVSVVSLLANTVVLPVIPAIMVLGALMVLVGLVYVPASLVFALPLTLLLTAVITVATVFSNLPGSALIVSIPTFVCAFMYLALGYLAFLLSDDDEKSSGYFL